MDVTPRELVIAGIVFVVVQSGIFTTPSDVKQQLTDLELRLSTQFVTKADHEAAQQKLDAKIDELKGLIKDLYPIRYKE